MSDLVYMIEALGDLRTAGAPTNLMDVLVTARNNQIQAEAIRPTDEEAFDGLRKETV